MAKATKICKVCGKEYDIVTQRVELQAHSDGKMLHVPPSMVVSTLLKLWSPVQMVSLSSEEVHHETHNYENMGDDEYDELFEEVFEDSEDEPAIHK